MYGPFISSNTEFCDLLAPRKLPVEDHLGNEARRKHIREETDYQRHRESLHGARAKEEQEKTGDDSRYVRIDDSPPRLAETRVHGRRNRFTCAQFFPYALENQHVRIDRHTDRQD